MNNTYWINFPYDDPLFNYKEYLKVILLYFGFSKDDEIWLYLMVHLVYDISASHPVYQLKSGVMQLVILPVWMCVHMYICMNVFTPTPTHSHTHTQLVCVHWLFRQHTQQLNDNPRLSTYPNCPIVNPPAHPLTPTQPPPPPLGLTHKNLSDTAKKLLAKLSTYC